MTGWLSLRIHRHFYRFLTLIDFISSIFRLFVVVSCDNLSRLLSWRSVSYSYRVRCVPPTNDATLPRSLPTEWRLQFPRTSTSMSDSSTLVSRRYDGFVDRLNSVDRQGVPAPQGLGDVACRINNNIPRRRVWCRLLYCPSHRLPPSCCQRACVYRAYLTGVRAMYLCLVACTRKRRHVQRTKRVRDSVVESVELYRNIGLNGVVWLRDAGATLGWIFDEFFCSRSRRLKCITDDRRLGQSAQTTSPFLYCNSRCSSFSSSTWYSSQVIMTD